MWRISSRSVGSFVVGWIAVYQSCEHRMNQKNNVSLVSILEIGQGLLGSSKNTSWVSRHYIYYTCAFPRLTTTSVFSKQERGWKGLQKGSLPIKSPTITNGYYRNRVTTIGIPQAEELFLLRHSSIYGLRLVIYIKLRRGRSFAFLL